MTNLEWLRTLSAEDLSEMHLLHCPYEMADQMPVTNHPCWKGFDNICDVTQEYCDNCVLKWLKEDRHE